MEWVKQPLTREVARAIRAANRVGRFECDNHRYVYTDLKELWITEDKRHAVLTHDKDPVWQYWVDDGAWRQVSVHLSRDRAKQAVRFEGSDEPVESGVYVVARKDDDSRIIRVRCSSYDGPEALRSIFARLNYVVTLEKVA